MKTILSAKQCFTVLFVIGFLGSLIAQSPKEQAVLNAELAIGTVCNLVYTKAATMSANGLPCEGNNDQVCFTTGCKPYSESQIFPLTVYVSIPTNCPYITKRGDTITGRIDMTFSGTIAQSNAVNVTVLLTDVKVNSIGASGNLAVTANKNSNQAINLTAKSANFNITSAKGQSLFFSDLTYNLTQVGGMATTFKTSGKAAVNDDSFDMTINGTAKDNTGTTVIVTTTTPLHNKYSCEWTVSGVLECKMGSLTSQIDYGTGTCDNLVTVTVGAVTKTMPLP